VKTCTTWVQALSERSSVEMATTHPLRSRLPALVVALVVVGLLGVVTYAIASPRASSELGVGGKINTGGKLYRFQGRTAGDFQLTGFDGQPVSLASYRGKVVVLNFWGSWCPPCQDEAPVLQAFAQRHTNSNVVLLGIDLWEQSEADARNFIAKFGLTYPNALDSAGHVAIEYGVSGVPETFVIAPDGRLLGKYTGPVKSVEQLESIIRDLGAPLS